MDMIDVYFDGASKNNGPDGIGSYAFVIRKDGNITFKQSHHLGRGFTNNQAEYEGAFEAIMKANELYPTEHKTLIGDSQLVIKQLSGEWKCKNNNIRSIYCACRRNLDNTWTFKWIPREENEEVNELCGGKEI